MRRNERVELRLVVRKLAVQLEHRGAERHPHLFHPVEELGISESRLRKLSHRTNLRFYLPYAMGTAPWFRIQEVNDPLRVPMANLSAHDLHALSDTLKAIPRGPSLFPGKFAQPFPLAEA